MARARFVLFALLVAAAAPLHAQGIASTSPALPLSVSATPAVTAPSDATAPLGPSMSAQRAAAHTTESSAPLRAMPQNAGLGQSRAMMIVGAAALVTGAIIGGTPGTLIMVGGGVVGLVGLYEYLQ